MKIVLTSSLFFLFLSLFSCSSSNEFEEYLINNDYYLDTNKIYIKGVNYLEYFIETEEFSKLRNEWKLAIYKTLMFCYERNDNYEKAIEYGLKMFKYYGPGYYYVHLNYHSDKYSFRGFGFPTYSDIGYLYLRNREYENSKLFFTKDLSENFTRGSIGLSDMYKNLKDYTQAIRQITSAINKEKNKEIKWERDKENLEKLYFTRGELYLEIDNNDKACEDFKKSMEFGNNEADKYILETCF